MVSSWFHKKKEAGGGGGGGGYTYTSHHATRAHQHQQHHSTNRSTRSTNSRSSGGSGSGVQNVIATCLYPPKQAALSGFSPLMLEHGEKVVMDWAVLASSFPVTSTDPNTAPTSMTTAPSIDTVDNNSRVPTSPPRLRAGSSSNVSTDVTTTTTIQWAQSPKIVHKLSQQASSSSSSSSTSLLMKQQQQQQQPILAHTQPVIIPNKESFPSCHLVRMEGRLHLCSRSLVLEPLDSSKPILRCPFVRMTNGPPKEYPNDSSSFETMCAEFVVSRHWSIKQNCTGPFENIAIPTRFQVTFLHSSPKLFVDLCQHFYNHSSSNNSIAGTSNNNADAMIIKPCDRPLDLHHLVDMREQVLAQFQCFLLTPLQEQPGVFCITTDRLYFQPSGSLITLNANNNNINNNTTTNTIMTNSTMLTRVSKWPKNKVLAFARRYHGLRDCALEIYFGGSDSSLMLSSSSSLLSSFASSSFTANTTTAAAASAIPATRNSILVALRGRHDREQAIRFLDPAAGTIVSNTGGAATSTSNNHHHSILCLTSREFVAQAFHEWQKGILSNFDYLLALNSAAGRSYQDLSRYPVFPWVIQDYESTKLDLSNQEKTFRDLTKPVGALNPQRLEYFRKRMHGMSDHGGGLYGNNGCGGGANGGGAVGDSSEAVEDDIFLYGTHYSAPGYVLYFLVRSMPEHMLCLQNGKFDAPDRMFHSISHCFKCALTNHADVKEVLPEFYNTTDFDFLLNTRGLQLGATQTGDRVDDVHLPPWAKSARDFIRKNRKALESPICTSMLPRWIDLIFGCTSRNKAAAKQANNLFHSSAYLTPNDLAAKSEEERAQAELHATEFGIVPDQLFTAPHPSRGEETAAPVKDDFIADIGRASPEDSSNIAGGGAWELLDHPPPMGMAVDDESDGMPIQGQTIEGRQDSINSGSNDAWAAPLSSSTPLPNEADDHDDGEMIDNNNNSINVTPVKNMPLRGKGEVSTSIQQRGDFGTLLSPLSQEITSTPSRPKPPSPKIQSFTDMPPSEWDMKMLERKHVHGDAVSGCILLVELVGNTKKQSILATTSLDGGLKVHKLSLGGPEDELERKGFPSTFGRFSYSTIMSRGQVSQTQTAPSKLCQYRSHTSRDPLASLVLASDGENGHVAFAGGHDDVVLAYGINSACAVASIYSHRDAVTGLDLIPRTPFDSDSSLWLEKSTHIMVSGSWDATVKVWSATVSSGEAVTINREPLAELFDADSSIVCVSAKAVPMTGGIVLAAGCADGSFCVWKIHADGVQVVIHKEPARRGSGSCSVVKWVSEGGHLSLFAAFSSGVVSSYTMVSDSTLQRMSAVSIGVNVVSLAHSDGYLWVGSSDGALRLIPVRDGGHFEKPTLWNAVNNKSAPGISSISVTAITNDDPGQKRFICCTGAEDGSIALFELHRRT